MAAQPSIDIAKFRELKVWQRGQQRAPHKPLLILLTLGKYAAGSERLIPYSEIDVPLKKLLQSFGPPRKSYHSEYPFWRLQNDGIWELANAEHVANRKSNRDAKKSELLKYNVVGGLNPELFEAIRADPESIKKISTDLLERCFPDSFHHDILESVGLKEIVDVSQRRRRDPNFRELVLRSYEYRCAICGLDLRMANCTVGLEAAHIKWFQYHGPDTADNGLCLCSLHHKLFDRGAIGLADNGILLVSELVNGSEGMDDWLLKHQGKRIRQPQSDDYTPASCFVSWHRKEVFRSPARRR